MVTFVRIARVVLLLLLAVFAISLVISIGSHTGPAEKVVLLALIGACVVAAAKVSSLAVAVEQRLHRR
jgi:hypothetical protein